MKAFKLNMHFRLPDDFKGDLNDAIEYMLQYRRKKDKGHSDIFNVDNNVDQYTDFWRMINTTDRVLLAETWIAEYNEVDGKWNYKDDLKIE